MFTFKIIIIVVCGIPGKSFKIVGDTITHFLRLVIVIKISDDVESGVRERVHRTKLGEVGQRRVQRFPWF